MENTTKAILIGVGLFITIALISAVLVIMGVGNNMIRNSSDELTGIADSLENDKLSQFNDKIVQGSEVSAAVKQYLNSTKLTIYVNNAGGSAAVTAPAATAQRTNTSLYVGCKALTGANLLNNRYVINSATYAGLANLATANKPDLAWISDPGSALYIKANSSYHAYLVYTTSGSNENLTVVGVYFCRA